MQLFILQMKQDEYLGIQCHSIVIILVHWQMAMYFSDLPVVALLELSKDIVQVQTQVLKQERVVVLLQALLHLNLLMKKLRKNLIMSLRWDTLLRSSIMTGFYLFIINIKGNLQKKWTTNVLH